MRTFLIDLENVKNQGLNGIDQLETTDRVFIYYSENANTLNIPTIQMMNRSKAQIDYVHLQHSGHNAMDFQIVALLGFLIGSERSGQFCIVSQDRGYLAPVEFFMDHAAGALDVHVLLSPSIQKAVNRWNQISRDQNQSKVMVADPEALLAAGEAGELQEASVEELTEAVEITAEEGKTPAAHIREAEQAVATETAPVIAAAEVAEKNAETEKPAEKSGRSRRGRRSGAKKAEAAAEKPAEQEAAHESTLKKPAEITAEQPAQNQKPVKKPVEKAADKQAEKTDVRKSERKSVKKTEKPIVVSKAFQEKIAGVIAPVVPEDMRGKFDRLVGEAILATGTKNEFYQYFRRTMGVQQGGTLYHAIRNEYERLTKALEETLS